MPDLPSSSGAVFLSYAREDGDAARRIADALRGFGVEVWFDVNELRGGDAWDAKIRRQIRECALFIPIVSSNTQARGEGYFRREWNQAVDRTRDMSENKAFIVPVISDGTPESVADVPEQFLRSQFTRLHGGVPTAQFVENVKRLLEESSTPTSRTVAPATSNTAARDTSGPDPKSIAVLPFTNMSPDKEQEYFSDGIAEELMNLLAQLPELRVAARTSSFFFKGQHVELGEIARKLNVAHILEGSVRKSGNRVRVTAQLIHAADGYHLWSQTWDRTLDDIFAVQDEIAGAVVAQLKVTLLGAVPKRKKTYNPEAYALHLQAKELSRRDTAEGHEEAIALFKEALQIDPALAPAWVGLSKCYWIQAANDLRSNQEGHELALEAVERALAIDPDLAAAHAMWSIVAITFESDSAAAARRMERALALEPTNIDIIGDALGVARRLGRRELCVRIGEYLVSHDPVNSQGHARLAGSYFRVGRYDDAIATGKLALRLAPGRAQTHYTIGLCLMMKGDAMSAVSELLLEPAESWRLDGMAMAFHAFGDREKSDAALAELIGRSGTEAAWNIAYVYAYRGEADLAFEWLDKAIECKDPGVGDTPWTPQFGPIMNDPRWMPLLRKIGAAPEQLAAIPFDVKLPGR